MMPMSVVALPSGNIVVNDVSLFGRAFRMFDPVLREVRSFGPTEVGKSMPDRADLVYMIASDSRGGIWAAKASKELRVLHFTDKGESLPSLLPPTRWFEPWQSDGRVRMTDPTRERPKPRVTGIWEDATGRLWLTGLVADHDWHRRLIPRFLGSRERRLLSPDESRTLFDSVIDVFDTTDGRLLAERFYDGVLAVSQNGILWETLEHPSGVRSLRIVSATCTC
jgi:hypothetical protein